MIDITQHKTFRQLKEDIEKSASSGLFNSFVVSGIPVELDSLLNEQFIDLSFFTTTLNTKSIIQYVNTTEEFQHDEIGYSALIRMLSKNGFSKVDRVSEKKEFSVKGDIINFWPSFLDFPYRIEFFGEDIEKLEIFDVTLNKQISKINQLVVPNENLIEGINNPIELKNFDKKFSQTLIIFDQFSTSSEYQFDFRQPQLFFNRFDILENYLKNFEDKGYRIAVITKHEENLPKPIQKFVVKELNNYSGLISDDLKLVILTDREIYGTIFLSNEISASAYSTESRKLLSQFEGEVAIGDYIVHEDHGIGIYNGIIQEKSSEHSTHPNNYIQLKYADSDELLVPLNMVYKITKFFGTSEGQPNLTHLGKSEWAQLTDKIKASVKIMASELIHHYAKISLAKIKRINEGDSKDYEKFVEKFEYDETEDQLRSIDEVNRDLALEKPMNRLLVGDVGFGKTEVIMRAAFKVIEAGKQVAVLAPTTVLTSQHEKVFKKRFEGFPFEIDSVSRFKDKYKNKDIIERLKDGKVDIIIGTHRLLSNDIDFKNLGMVVIDEEQKFGVKQKEKLKKLKYGVHVLATSATPIPRTLSMALSSIQDISIIQTPPPGRKPIKTYVEKLDWNTIINAIKKETVRNGQVFLVYNSVKTIFSIAKRLKTLAPEINFAVAHGKMTGEQIETIMTQFFNKEYDVLLSTTIIENGIDMSNVNTLIVMKSQNFGLSQLYQLRGRVGRGSREAFAYFFYDGLDVTEENTLTMNEDGEKKKPKDYIKRLLALKQIKELGASFEIASKDLEIRGAGNILGEEQHGNINKIGYGLYMQLLAQEIERLKNSN